MKTTKMKLPVVLGACAALTVMTALQGASAEPRGAYLKLDAGANFMQDLDVNVGGSQFTQEMDTGFRVDVIGGYNINEFLALELETGFLYNEPKDVSDVWVGAVPVLGNVILRYENDSPFLPYIGAGAGGAFTLLDNSQEVENDFVFAYQLQAGVAYELSPDMAIDLGYKYFATADQHYDETELSDVKNHFVGLSFSFHF